MPTLESVPENDILAAANLVLLDHPYAALLVPLPKGSCACPSDPSLMTVELPGGPEPSTPSLVPVKPMPGDPNPSDPSPVLVALPSESRPFESSSEGGKTPLDRGLRHADEFYKRLVRDTSQRQVNYLLDILLDCFPLR